MDRRRFITRTGALGVAAVASPPANPSPRAPVVNDVSRLNPTAVARVIRPRDTSAVSEAVGRWDGPVSIGGGRFSMGGQVAAPASLHLDMRAMNRIIRLDPDQRRVRVQAGTTWRDLQDAIDPHDCSVRIMQSYANFTVGGSVSVNCHGRYVGRGPLINSVRSLQLVTAEGTVLEVGPRTRPDLFAAVLGGYGGLGIVTEVELDLADNPVIERRVEPVALAEYPAFFAERVQHEPDAVLHNADLAPPDFAAPLAVTWLRSDRPVTEPRRLVPRDLDYTAERNAIWAITELPLGDWLRREVLTPARFGSDAVVHLNFEASLDADSLEPRTRAFSTYLLQEYFVPVAAFASFAREMRRILRAHEVAALNVSIRHSPADSRTLLTWCPDEVFSFVLYYKQRRSPGAERRAGHWTRELIAAALDAGGRYYLPYRLDATEEQFRRAYPGWRDYLALKADIDPQGRLRNALVDRYLAA